MKPLVDIFLEFRPLMYKLVGRIVRPDEVEDIVQETFVQSYAASRVKKLANPRAFMLVTAKNIALNYLKRADRRLNCPIEGIFDEEFAALTVSVEDNYQAEEKFLIFCRAVHTLPICCRRVFIYKKVYGFTQKEIADRLGISTSMVEKHLVKGLAMTVRYMLKNGHPMGLAIEDASAHKNDEARRK